MDFLTETRLKKLGDPMLSYSFELRIPRISDITDKITSDELTVHVRTTSLPGRSNEVIESNFAGSKQFFPGRVSFTNTLSVTFEEFREQKISQAIYDWQQILFQHDPDEANPGATLRESKRGNEGYSKSIYLIPYHRNDVKLERSYELFNAYPVSISEPGMDYAANDSVKFDVTFQYDFWRFVRL